MSAKFSHEFDSCQFVEVPESVLAVHVGHFLVVPDLVVEIVVTLESFS